MVALNVQVAANNEWIFLEISIGMVLFNLFVYDMESGIECALSKIADDTKLCVVADTLKGRDAI